MPGPAILLRQWTEEDVEALVEAYRDRTLRRFTRLPVRNAGDARRWLTVQQDGWASRRRFSFAVVEEPAGASTGRLVGNVALKTTDLASGSAEVGYWTAAYARGQGVASRALDALTRWAFEAFATEGLNLLVLNHRWTTSRRAGSRRRPVTGSSGFCRPGHPSRWTAIGIPGGRSLREQ